MPKTMTLNDQAKKFISEHPDSEAAPLLKDLLRALDNCDVNTAIREAASSRDHGIFLDSIINALSRTHLCAACQGRIQSTIIDACDVAD